MQFFFFFTAMEKMAVKKKSSVDTVEGLATRLHVECLKAVILFHLKPTHLLANKNAQATIPAGVHPSTGCFV